MSRLISVVMSHYNTDPEYLRQALDSLCAQTCRNLEIIVSDDGSREEYRQVLREYADPRVRVLFSPENRGQSAALNAAIDQARGEYIAVMDSDDVSLPQRIEKEAAYLDAHPDVMVLGSWARCFQDSDRFLCPDFEDQIHYRVRLLFNNAPGIPHSSVMFRAAVFKEMHFAYNPAFRAATDYELWSRLSQKVRFAILHEDLIRYRAHPMQISSAQMKKQEQSASMVRKNQLSMLGLETDEGDLEEIRDLLDRPVTRKRMEWVKKILDANQNRKIYPEPEFSRRLLYEFGSAAVHTYFEQGKAGLEGYRELFGWKEYGKLQIRCLAHRLKKGR